MKLEYVGFRPIISEKGIFFKDGKDDKFIYFNNAINILTAIDKDYEQNKDYSSNFSNKLSSDQIFNTLENYCTNLKDSITKRVEQYKQKLKDEIISLEQKSTLSEFEKNIFINNLKFMEEYKITRARNKIFYFHCINAIYNTIVQNRIKKIDTPFDENFWHVLKSIQGKLANEKIASKIETSIDENDNLKATLLVNIY